MRIYWANALFSHADIDFNAKCAAILREAGYEVFLPQEMEINDPNEQKSPSPDDIFRLDTSQILESDLLVACLDQETIDSGVACEVGIAFAYGIPVIGLYTDIRQHREGQSRMYKNPYVVGAIRAHGEIVTDIENLLRVVPTYNTREGVSPEQPATHFGFMSTEYDQFVSRLENWYIPPWNPRVVLDKWLDILRPKRIIEVGCGTGKMGKYIANKYHDVTYVGYDKSPDMIRAASEGNSTNATFTAQWQDVVDMASTNPFDLALVFFTLHDIVEQEDFMRKIVNLLVSQGVILLVDLSTEDFPILTTFLRKRLARPLQSLDFRLSPIKVSQLAQTLGAHLIGCEFSLPRVTFPSAQDVDSYLDLFGIYAGMDFPLLLTRGKADYMSIIKTILHDLHYPFTDQRSFLICALQIKQTRLGS